MTSDALLKLHGNSWIAEYVLGTMLRSTELVVDLDLDSAVCEGHFPHVCFGFARPVGGCKKEGCSKDRCPGPWEGFYTLDKTGEVG